MRIPAKQLELRSASRYRTAADSGTISALLMEFLLEEKKLGRAVRTAARADLSSIKSSTVDKKQLIDSQLFNGRGRMGRRPRRQVDPTAIRFLPRDFFRIRRHNGDNYRRGNGAGKTEEASLR
jgi:hypothetical protein